VGIQVTAEASRTRVRSARLATMVVFFVNGAVFATWATRVPAMTSALSMGPGALAAVVFGLSAGALTGLPLAGWLCGRFGSVRVSRGALVLYAGSLAVVPHSPSVGLLAVALVGLGLGNGLLDVAMNTAAIRVERRYPRQIMASFHAQFSFGGLGGAIAGTILAGLGVSAQTHLTVGALVLCCCGTVASFGLLPDQGERTAGRSAPARDRRLIGLGLLVLCGLVCEGIPFDWSAVYVQDVLGGGPGVAAAGFALFSLTMTVSRLLADRLVARIGAVALLRLAGLFAAVSFGACLTGSTPVAGLVGFGALGLGLGGILPTLFSAAARTHPRPATAISTVSTIGYLGFLAGPPIVGVVASASSLRIGLGVVVVLALVIAAGAGAVRTSG
jgi:MFS family permease